MFCAKANLEIQTNHLDVREKGRYWSRSHTWDKPKPWWWHSWVESWHSSVESWDLHQSTLAKKGKMLMSVCQGITCDLYVPRYCPGEVVRAWMSLGCPVLLVSKLKFPILGRRESAGKSRYLLTKIKLEKKKKSPHITWRKDKLISWSRGYVCLGLRWSIVCLGYMLHNK